MIERFVDGVLRRRWDGVEGIYTAWDAAGLVVESRPLNEAEVAVLDERAAAEAAAVVVGAQVEQARAAIADNAAFLALDPPTAAEVVGQVRALTRQVSDLIRIVARGLL